MLDQSVEKDESFSIELFDPKDVRLGRVTKTVVTIINDDSNILITISPIFLKILYTFSSYLI